MKKVFIYLLACAFAGISLTLNAMEQSAVSNFDQALQCYAQVALPFNDERAAKLAQEYLEQVEQASRVPFVKDYEQVLQSYAQAAAPIKNDYYGEQGRRLTKEYKEKLEQISPIPLCMVGNCIVKFERIQGEWRKELSQVSRRRNILDILKSFRESFKKVHARKFIDPQDTIRNQETRIGALSVVRYNLEKVSGLYVSDLSNMSDEDLNTLVDQLII